MGVVKFLCQTDIYILFLVWNSVQTSPVRHAKFQSIQYFIDIDIFRNLLIDIDIFQNLLIDIDIDIFQNSPIDIDIFQNSLIDIDIFRMALSISIFSKFADISTIDINIRYSIHKTGGKTPK